MLQYNDFRELYMSNIFPDGIFQEIWIRTIKCDASMQVSLGTYEKR